MKKRNKIIVLILIILFFIFLVLLKNSNVLTFDIGKYTNTIIIHDTILAKKILKKDKSFVRNRFGQKFIKTYANGDMIVIMKDINPNDLIIKVIKPIRGGY